MSVLSLPSQSFSSSPLDALFTKLRRAGQALYALATQVPTNEPRTRQEVLVWARSLEAHQPSLAAELTAIASRSDV